MAASALQCWWYAWVAYRKRRKILWLSRLENQGACYQRPNLHFIPTRRVISWPHREILLEILRDLRPSRAARRISRADGLPGDNYSIDCVIHRTIRERGAPCADFSAGAKIQAHVSKPLSSFPEFHA